MYAADFVDGACRRTTSIDSSVSFRTIGPTSSPNTTTMVPTTMPQLPWPPGSSATGTVFARLHGVGSMVY
ncbi:MAG: hypothetical protein A2V70_14645 [Planctomycetes bacterium RBG_13_63_9]|nr:MAG: hypothetical protein A2V70_14645 [Planctomycetes bacterium RBG_13_63_9]